MPIFAKTKLVIHENCLEPVQGSPHPGAGFIDLKYVGPNPQDLYAKIKELFFSIYKIDIHELQEKDIVWDRSKGEEKFRVSFDMIKDLDTFSFMQVLVRLSGEAKQSKDFGKEGSASIRIEGRVRTEYPQDTLWQRSLFYEMVRVFYDRVLYVEKRKKYVQQCRTELSMLLSEIKSFLGILSEHS